MQRGLSNLWGNGRSWLLLAEKESHCQQLGRFVDEDCCSTSSTVEKGHLVVYSNDRKRFVLPLEYFSNKIARELFKLGEDEFGLPGNRPMTLPCDSVSVKYIINMMQRHVTKDIEKALLVSMASREKKTLFKILNFFNIFMLKINFYVSEKY